MARRNELADKIDAIIGTKIKELRLISGLSRVQLGKKVGVTHQQLCKYEMGTNRISPGRLLVLAKELNSPISYFFDDVDYVGLPTQHQVMCLQVSRNFMNITNPIHQEAVNTLVRSLSTHN